MSIAGLSLALALCVTAADEQAPAESVTTSMWAVRATQEHREQPHFDAGLEAIREAVKELPYDTYRKVQVTRRPMPMKKETRLKIDERYTLCVTPVAREPDGRIRLDLYVEMAPKKKEDKPVKALVLVGLEIQKDKKVTLGGLKLTDGALVIVLAAN